MLGSFERKRAFRAVTLESDACSLLLLLLNGYIILKKKIIDKGADLSEFVFVDFRT